MSRLQLGDGLLQSPVHLRPPGSQERGVGRWRRGGSSSNEGDSFCGDSRVSLLLFILGGLRDAEDCRRLLRDGAPGDLAAEPAGAAEAQGRRLRGGAVDRGPVPLVRRGRALRFRLRLWTLAGRVDSITTGPDRGWRLHLSGALPHVRQGGAVGGGGAAGLAGCPTARRAGRPIPTASLHLKQYHPILMMREKSFRAI